MSISRIATLIFASAAALAAQQDRVTVPLSNPAQPATIKVHLLSGSITVTAGSGSQVIVEPRESDGSARQRDRGHDRDSDVPPGMHRLDSGAGLNVEEDHNVVTIGTGAARHSDIVIQVPANSSLDLKTLSGGRIDVTGINGEIDVQNLNGAVNLTNVSGAVVAHGLNGAITASLDRVAPDKPMSFTSLNGRIDVTLPAATKARLRLKTDNGAIYSDFDVKLDAGNKPVVEDARKKGGKYRIRIDKSVYGSINGGGPEYVFQTMNGDILIHKK